MLANEQNNKYSINLLQAELLPEKVLLTLTRVVTLWCLVLVFMIAWFLGLSYTQSQHKNEIKALQQHNTEYSSKLQELTNQLAKRKANATLTDELSLVKLLIDNKKSLHKSLIDSNQTYVAGFASAMAELAELHSRDIRLQSIHMSNEIMTFSGLALTPEAVPAWLAGFENSLLLSGKSFEYFKLSESEGDLNHLTEFTVSSKVMQKELP